MGPQAGQQMTTRFSLAAFFLVTFSNVAPAAERTNVVLILADDLGYGDLGCYGHPRFKTPHIDQLAKDGARLTDFYAPVPFCAPTRAALLTGRYPAQCGMSLNPVPAADPGGRGADHLGLNVDEKTLADRLRAAGYRTACFGKWHLGHRPQFRPLRRGFDDFYGILYSNDMHPVELWDGERRVEYPLVQTTLTRRLTQRAVNFINDNKDRPFFLYLPQIAVHKPLAPGEAFYKQTGAGLYADAVAELDWSVGQIIARLAQLRLEQNTLVIFTSDNGPWYGGSTGGLRGMKGNTWEGGIRVPLVARLPGRIPAGHTSREPAIMMDLFPMILTFAGVDPTSQCGAEGRTIDGRDIRPLMNSPTPSPHEALFFFKGETLSAIRAGRWKLHLASPGGAGAAIKKPGERWLDPRRPDGVRILAPYEQYQPTEFPGITTGDRFDRVALFDLVADPAEQRDLSSRQAAVVQDLTDRATRFRMELSAPAKR
jgi:uncharacterized sulfatase